MNAVKSWVYALDSGFDGPLPQLRFPTPCNGLSIRMTSRVRDEMINGSGVDELGTGLVE